jgi:hypothetical protein
MANNKQSSNINNNINNNKGLDVHTDKNNNSNKQHVELASVLKKNIKYSPTTSTTSSNPTTTTLASPTTNPPSTTIIQLMAHYTAITDTAAMGNYIMTACPVTNQQPTAHGIDVILPDGSSITSSHTALLQLPNILPLIAQLAHMFPDLKSSSLISIGQLCDHGCTATFDSTQVHIHYQDDIIMTGF